MIAYLQGSGHLDLSVHMDTSSKCYVTSVQYEGDMPQGCPSLVWKRHIDILSFAKCVWSTCFVLGTAVSARYIVVTKTNAVLWGNFYLNCQRECVRGTWSNLGPQERS